MFRIFLTKSLGLALALMSMVGAADVYQIDQAHSAIKFAVKHMVIATVEGKFNDFKGTITYDENDPSKISAEVTIKTGSIDTDNQKRDDHLRSPDFFDAAKYPTITFKTKKVEKRGNQLVAVGDLTMHGVTKEIEIPFEITGKIVDPWGKTRIGIEGSSKINRQDFGVKWNQTMDAGGLVVSDDVKIYIHVEAVK